MNTLTLQNVKDQYYLDLAHGDIGRQGFEEYVRAYYMPCYDDELNFLGYEAKTSYYTRQLLDKHRYQLHKQEHERRKALKTNFNQKEQ